MQLITYGEQFIQYTVFITNHTEQEIGFVRKHHNIHL